MPLQKEIIEELKQKLLQEKKELEEDIKKIARPLNSKDEHFETAFENIGSDVDENANEVEQYSDNLAIESRLEQKLGDVNKALKEIEEGTYGICRNCNQEIGIERLRANPSARTCIKCE